MLGDRRGGARVDVRGWAHLERHAPVAHKGREAAEVGAAVGVQGDVVDDPDAMAEPLGAAPLERLVDRRQAERFARVDRQVEILVADMVEGVEVARRPVAGLRPGDVEAHDALVAPAHGEAGDLGRSFELAHRRNERPDDDPGAGGRGPPLALAETVLDGLHHPVERQAALDVEFRRAAHLGIRDAVRGEILGALGRDPDERVALLHDADGVGKRLEVQLERLSICAASEPGREIVDVRRRQATVLELARQVDDRRRTKAAVEVIVEQRLRSRADRLEREQRPGPRVRSRACNRPAADGSAPRSIGDCLASEL